MPRLLFVKTGETDTAEEQRAFASVAEGGGHSRFVLKDVCDVLDVDTRDVNRRLEEPDVDTTHIRSETAGQNAPC